MMNSMVQAGGQHYGKGDTAQNDYLLPLRRNDISVFLCLSGSAVLYMNDKRYKVEKGWGYVVLHGRSFALADTSRDYTFIETVIPVSTLKETITLNNIAADVALLSQYPVFDLDDKDQENFMHILGLCQNLKTRQGKYQEKSLQNTYISLVYLVCEAVQKGHAVISKEYSSGVDRQYYYFMNFLNLLAQHCREQRNVNFYARKLCITPKYLSTIVKNVSGRTAGGWIDEFVISEAKQHLRFSEKSIQEISYMLNFSTQSFFGKYFKRLTGMSPIRYKTLSATA